MQLGRADWDKRRDPATSPIAFNPFDTLGLIWRDRRLRYMGFVGSCFSWGQFVVASYTVVACVRTLGMSLVAAGTVLTAVQIGNAGGRVFAGWLADRVGASTPVLRWIAWLMLGSAVTAFWMSSRWPLPLLYALFVSLGIATGAWAGMVMAEIGRRAPADKVGAAMGGALVYVNIGKFIGPIVFANVYLTSGSYPTAFASLVMPAAAALLLLARIGGGRTSPAAPAALTVR
jgi:MFS transporter, NNP family, nitrate/nitrite transporter